MGAYLEMAAAEKMKDGLSRKDALRAVRLEHGTLEVTKEIVRSAGWKSFGETVWQDLRFASRMLRKNPGFAAVAVLTLALGIGANTAIFSLVNGILLVPLPYPGPEQLVSITGTYPKGGAVAMREQVHTMDVAAYYEGHEFNLTGQGQPVRLTGAVVSAEFFFVLGARIDWRVLVFTSGLALLTGLLSGLAPALQLSRTAPTEMLRSGGRAGTLPLSRRLRSSLVVAEVAFALLLVTAAGLLIRSFWTLSHVNPGFRSEHILTARISPNQSFCNDPERCLAFYRTLLEQARTSPGVESAALVNTLPLGGRVAKRSLEAENHTPPSPGQDLVPLFWLHVVTPDYFRVMGIPILSGRTFTDADASGEPVSIIPAETARRFWPNQNAVGKHIHMLDDKSWRTVVGVTGDVRA